MTAQLACEPTTTERINVPSEIRARPVCFKRRCLLDDNIVPQREPRTWKRSLIYKGPCLLIHLLPLHRKQEERSFECGDNLHMKEYLKYFWYLFFFFVLPLSQQSKSMQWVSPHRIKLTWTRTRPCSQNISKVLSPAPPQYGLPHFFSFH